MPFVIPSVVSFLRFWVAAHADLARGLASLRGGLKGHVALVRWALFFKRRGARLHAAFKGRHTEFPAA